MNIFEREKAIIGEVGTKCGKQDLEIFFDQAAKISTRLGEQAYLLDRYLSQLFEARVQKLFHDAAGDGFDMAGQLIGICAGIIRGESEYSGHWFYDQAKKYIDRHPFSYQEVHTKVMLYCLALHEDFIERLAEQFYAGVCKDIRTVLDICDLNDLYTMICNLLGSEADMENLNTLFCRRFLSVNTMTAYYQGASDQLLYALTYRDRESSKQIFRIWMDME